MSTSPLGWDPNNQSIEKRLITGSLRYDKNENLQEYIEPKKKLDVFKSTLELKTGQLSDTASPNTGEFDQSGHTDMLHKHQGRSKDDLNVSYDQQIKADHQTFETRLDTNQLRRGFYLISQVLYRDGYKPLDKLTDTKLTDGYLKQKNIEPREFKETGAKLYKMLKASLEGDPVSRLDYEIAYNKFDRMVKKLGDIDKRIIDSRRIREA